MLSKLLKAYRYYHYRLYLFHLRNFNSGQHKASTAALGLMFTMFMFNLLVIVVLLSGKSKQRIFPDLNDHRKEEFIFAFIFAAFYMLFNHLVLPGTDEIAKEFENEDKKSFRKRGWIISVYMICSILIIYSPLFSILDIGSRSVVDSMPIPLSAEQDSLKKVKMENAVEQIRKNGY